ncbi:MAG: twin-arginine translocase subunit TatC [Nitrospina sp.]|nr:twin-arginine translocase subunit TatC [Nitrospina sp.]MBT3856151.1 twin-arginine translocase subunit TatC [Nitrospina sp.]MBT4105813.1 twin-arginine translocase subunit TatC [Nitrospina sp.]MBT4390831.1 twin-arginine translocase subunit TatC [Nitrospina sp.]MBT4622269.1 twin-arginine translocase subunit TatC [Nitrospina sp.]
MVKEVDFTEKIPVTHHLIELKNRMIQVALVVALFFGVCFYFIDFLLLWLESPLPKQYADLTFITPTEPFFTAMKVSFMGSMFISMPWILYHVWGFIAPGLKVKEKKVTAMFVFFGTVFFLFGGLFCYFLVVPLGLKFLLNYGTTWWKMQVTIGFYFSFVVKMILAFAFAFQTPLIMVLLTKFGVINTVKMKLYRKWAFLGTFALAAVLTPPDIITQVLLAFPLYGLYEFGIIVSRFFEDPKNREMAVQQMQREAAAKKAAKEAAQRAAMARSAEQKSAKKAARKAAS